jgi:hypothetical protein
VDDELIYLQGQLSAEQVEQEIGHFWAELDTSAELQADLAAKGIDSATLRKIRPNDPIRVRAESTSIIPGHQTIRITFAPVANKILKDVWGAVILPRIARRWGADAIGYGLGGDHSGD